MEEISQLIQETIADEASAEKAVAKLVSIGMPSVPAVINAIRSGSGDIWKLSQVLLQIRHPDLVPVFIELLQQKNTDLIMIASEGLGQSRDERALQPLLNALSDGRQSMAVEAMGELRNPQAVEPLVKVAKEILNQPSVSQAIEEILDIDKEDFDESPVRFLPTIIIALAKLGNYEIAPVTISLTRYHSDGIYSDAEIIRTNATKALQYVVTPGMFPALQAALNDDYDEVRLQAVDSLFYLGTKEVIPELIACVQDENSIVRNNVLVRLHDLTDTWFKDDAKVGELQEWWEQHQTEYERGVCYRLSKPLHLPDVIVLLDDIYNQKTIMQELKVITGINFGSHPDAVSQSPGVLVQLAQEWWKEEGHNFEDGCLYKYGYKHNINNIF